MAGVREVHGDNVQYGDKNIMNILYDIKDTIGPAYAANYFYAHIEVIIRQGLSNKIESYINDKNLAVNGIKMAKKLYIFVPKNGNCPNLISIKDPVMSEAHSILIREDYAGASRPHNNIVWAFEKDDQCYQAVAEYATILHALTKMPRYDEEQIEKITKKFRSALQVFINNLGADQFVELVDIDPSQMISESDILKEKIDNNF